ncbi:hypothetical protein C8F00_3167 [Xanthomonas vasicola]
MHTNRIALPRAVASTSRAEEASTSQSPATCPLPDPPPAHIQQDERFDRLTPLPRDLRREILGRLDRRSIARLGATSRAMAEAARDRMELFLEAHPRYDPLTDCGRVRSLKDMRATLRMVTRLPYPGGEDHGARLTACFQLVKRAAKLPQSERAEALMALLEHINQLPGQPTLPTLSRLTEQLGIVPREQREAYLTKVLQAAQAVHDQVAQPDAVQGGDAALEMLSAESRLLKIAYIRNFIPLSMLLRAVANLAAGQPGPPAQAEATLLHEVTAGLQITGWFMERHKYVVEACARLANGRDVLNHMVDLSVTLPDPQMRWTSFGALANASSLFSRRKDTAFLLVRLANVLPQQPEAERYQGGELLLLEALQLDRRRFKAVCAAVRAQADAIPGRSADFIAMCARTTALADSRPASSWCCW